MKAIVPIDISLLATNIAANSQDEWDDETTYDLGDEVVVSDAVPHTVYRSLRGNNTGRNPADWLVPQKETATSVSSVVVATGSITLTVEPALGFSAGMVVKIAKTVTPATVNMTGEVTAYNTGTGQLSVSVYTSKGDGSHSGWTVTSEDEIGFWEEIGATEQYKMFDGYVNTVSERTDSIIVKLATSRVDMVSLFGLQGHSVELYLRDESDTTLLWSTTVDLIYGSPVTVTISDWYEYFFGELSAMEDITKTIDVNSYSGVLEIRIIAASGETAACGGLVLGRALDLGTTLYGFSAGIIDYSVKETDDLGRTTMSQGYWAKRCEVDVKIRNGMVDHVARKLARLRGIATAWIGSDVEGELELITVYGTFKDFSITAKGPNHTYCNIEIEGLI